MKASVGDGRRPPRSASAASGGRRIAPLQLLEQRARQAALRRPRRSQRPRPRHDAAGRRRRAATCTTRSTADRTCSCHRRVGQLEPRHQAPSSRSAAAPRSGEPAWTVVSDPSWPVFIACSMSSASGPRTSPTMMRSGRMRSAFRTSARSVDLAAALDVRRPRLEPRHVRQRQRSSAASSTVTMRSVGIDVRGERVQKRRLAGTGAAADDDVQPRRCTARRSSAASAAIEAAAARPCRSSVSCRSGNRRIVSSGPSTASGGSTAFTRLPSGRRASTIGLDSSTRRPTAPTIRSITSRRWALVPELRPLAHQPPAALGVDRRTAVHDHLGDRRVAQQAVQRPVPERVVDHARDQAIDVARRQRHPVDARSARAAAGRRDRAAAAAAESPLGDELDAGCDRGSRRRALEPSLTRCHGLGECAQRRERAVLRPLGKIDSRRSYRRPSAADDPSPPRRSHIRRCATTVRSESSARRLQRLTTTPAVSTGAPQRAAAVSSAPRRHRRTQVGGHDDQQPVDADQRSRARRRPSAGRRRRHRACTVDRAARAPAPSRAPAPTSSSAAGSGGDVRSAALPAGVNTVCECSREGAVRPGRDRPATRRRRRPVSAFRSSQPWLISTRAPPPSWASASATADVPTPPEPPTTAVIVPRRAAGHRSARAGRVGDRLGEHAGRGWRRDDGADAGRERRLVGLDARIAGERDHARVRARGDELGGERRPPAGRAHHTRAARRRTAAPREREPAARRRSPRCWGRAAASRSAAHRARGRPRRSRTARSRSPCAAFRVGHEP